MSRRNNVFASPSILHDLTDSSGDSYGNFKKHLSQSGDDDNCGSSDDDTNKSKNPQSKKRKSVLPSSPATLKPKKLFSRLPTNVPRLRKSRIDKFCSELQKKSEEQPDSSHSLLEYSPGHVSTRSRQNATNTIHSSVRVESAGKKAIQTQKKANKKKDKSYEKIVLKHVENGKNATANESEVPCEESVHGLSDTAVDLFLQRFDQEMARDSANDEVVNVDSDSNVVEREENFTQNRTLKSKLSKGKGKSKVCNLSNTSKRNTRKASDSSDTDSISSVTSNTSRYGRIRKTTPVYVQATMFQGTHKKPNEVKQRASSFINSHRCQNRTLSTFSRSSSIDETGNEKSDPTEILTPPRNKKSVLQQSVQQSTPTKGNNSKIKRATPNGLIALQSSHRNRCENIHEAETEQSHDECDDNVVKINDCDDFFKKPTNVQILRRNYVDTLNNTSKRPNKNTEPIEPVKSTPKRLNKNTDVEMFCEECDDSASMVHDPKDVFKRPMSVSKQRRRGSTFSNLEEPAVVVLENVLLNSSSPRKPVKLVKPSLQAVERDSSMAGSFYNNISQTTFQAVDDDFGGNFDNYRQKPDQSKIHAVVNDDVISLKWFASPPNLDVELSNGTNMICSLPDFKQYFSTSTAGYLKIEAGGENAMQILKKCYMFYKVERGEAIVRLPERTRIAQVGSIFFIPQGAEYTIRNSSSEEELILLFVKMSPPT